MLYRNKKAHDISQGKWLGVGGKFLPGESAETCLLREVREETGFELASWDYRGIVHFLNDIYEDEEMHLFTASPSRADMAQLQRDGRLPGELAGNVTGGAAACLRGIGVTPANMPVPSCNEGTFAWIPLEDVAKLPLWEGDRIFLAQLAAGEHGIDLTVSYHGDELISVRNGCDL